MPVDVVCCATGINRPPVSDDGLRLAIDVAEASIRPGSNPAEAAVVTAVVTVAAEAAVMTAVVAMAAEAAVVTAVVTVAAEAGAAVPVAGARSGNARCDGM